VQSYWSSFGFSILNKGIVSVFGSRDIIFRGDSEWGDCVQKSNTKAHSDSFNLFNYSHLFCLLDQLITKDCEFEKDFCEAVMEKIDTSKWLLN